MLSNFKRDLAAARDAEILVLQLLMGATDDYDFFWVGDNREYFNKGDIKAIDKATGKESYIEVKDDSRIADTHNILCEEQIDYFDYQVNITKLGLQDIAIKGMYIYKEEIAMWNITREFEVSKRW